jgi:hypothetical protein
MLEEILLVLPVESPVVHRWMLTCVFFISIAKSFAWLRISCVFSVGVMLSDMIANP